MDSVKDLIYSQEFNINQEDYAYYNSIMYIYENAMKVLNTKLNIIKSEYDREKVHSDIQNIKYRIKSLDSIAAKLKDDGLEVNLENMTSINDIVGARIICLDLDDVNRVIDMIKNIPSIRILNEKDYIKEPKESGYRSYHMIVEIDTPVGNSIFPVKAEIQVRTLLMDAWSSLEHEIIYKNKNCSEDSRKELLRFSYSLSALEDSMRLIRNKEMHNNLDEKRKIKRSDLNQFKEYSYIYEAAASILSNNIELVCKEYNRLGNNSDIQKVKLRTKSIESIDKKLNDNNLEFNLANIQNNIKDVVAARIICLDLDDVNEMVRLIKECPFINIVKEKDYINNPKKSGYRAHHLIVEVPVELSSGVQNVLCEIQVRTVLMDAWSSLEHETIYKNSNCTEESKIKLRDYSYLLASMDDTMVNIKHSEVERLKSLNNSDSTSIKKLNKVIKNG